MASKFNEMMKPDYIISEKQFLSIRHSDAMVAKEVYFFSKHRKNIAISHGAGERGRDMFVCGRTLES